MSVIEWLLDSDPSIRWQVMRDAIARDERTVLPLIVTSLNTSADNRGGITAP